MAAWTDLEQLVRKAAGAETDGVSFSSAVDDLVRRGGLQAATAEALRGLEQLRNLADDAPNDETLAPRVAHFTTMAKALRWTVEHNLKQAGNPPH